MPLDLSLDITAFIFNRFLILFTAEIITRGIRKADGSEADLWVMAVASHMIYENNKF